MMVTAMPTEARRRDHHRNHSSHQGLVPRTIHFRRIRAPSTMVAFSSHTTTITAITTTIAPTTSIITTTTTTPTRENSTSRAITTTTTTTTTTETTTTITAINNNATITTTTSKSHIISPTRDHMCPVTRSTCSSTMTGRWWTTRGIKGQVHAIRLGAWVNEMHKLYLLLVKALVLSKTKLNSCCGVFSNQIHSNKTNVYILL